MVVCMSFCNNLVTKRYGMFFLLLLLLLLFSPAVHINIIKRWFLEKIFLYCYLSHNSFQACCTDGQLFNHLETVWNLKPGIPNNPQSCTLYFYVSNFFLLIKWLFCVCSFKIYILFCTIWEFYIIFLAIIWYFWFHFHLFFMYQKKWKMPQKCLQATSWFLYTIYTMDSNALFFLSLNSASGLTYPEISENWE